MTLGKVINPKEGVEMRCHGFTDLCLWDYEVKHYLVIVVGVFFENLTEGREKKKKVPGVECGNLSVPPGALKKEKKKNQC